MRAHIRDADMQQLTFTRFVAAMSVVVFHWSLHTPGLLEATRDFRVLLGQTMVSYFFVLSGFIMASVYDRPGTKVDAWRYWGMRVARIYPVYLLGLIWMAALLHAGIGDTRHDAPALLLGALMLQAWSPAFALSVNAPAWSLSAEAFFYLLFPWALLAMDRMRGSAMVFVATAIVWLLSLAAHLWALSRLFGNDPVVGHEFLYYNPLMHFNSFLVGMCAGMLVKRHLGVLRTGPGASFPLATIVVLVLSPVLAAAIALNLDAINAWTRLPFTPTNGLLAPLFALFIAALSIDGSALSTFLRQAPLVLLGHISYAIYILHIPVSWSLRSALPDMFPVSHPVATFAIYVVALLAVSYASFRWMETPLRSAARRHLSRPADSRGPVPGS